MLCWVSDPYSLSPYCCFIDPCICPSRGPDEFIPQLEYDLFVDYKPILEYELNGSNVRCSLNLYRKNSTTCNFKSAIGRCGTTHAVYRCMACAVGHKEVCFVMMAQDSRYETPKSMVVTCPAYQIKHPGVGVFHATMRYVQSDDVQDSENDSFLEEFNRSILSI